MLRSLGILIVALSLVAGPGWFVPLAVECPRCADHCPMKKPRLGCHSKQGSHAPCHSGPRFASSACSHGMAAAAFEREVALLVPPSPPQAADAAKPLFEIARLSPDAPTIDPPLDPPRFRFSA
jgi:hypothetical protein